MRTYPRRTDLAGGFSLIEVVLALAVISVGLIAVVGLIPQGIQSARDAADNTLAATIVQDTINTIRQQAVQTTGGIWPPAFPSTYYDAQGTNAIPVTDVQDAYFHVFVNPQVSSSSGTLLYVVTTTITWPDKPGFTGALNSNVFVTTIANYQH
jgi:uncharacterized protein (TIGR02598 family)